LTRVFEKVKLESEETKICPRRKRKNVVVNRGSRKKE